MVQINSSENSVSKSSGSQDEKLKVWRKCPECKHVWKGKPSSPKCSRKECRNYIGHIKDGNIKKRTDLGGILVDATNDERMPGRDDFENPNLPDLPDGHRKDAEEAEETSGFDVEEKVDLPQQSYEPIVDYPFKYIAQYTGHEHWQLTEEEKEMLSNQVKKVGDKWLPRLASKYTEEATLGLYLFMVVSGKTMTEARLKRQAEQAEDQEDEEEEDNAEEED